MFDLASFLPRAVMQGIPLLYGSTGEILTEKSGNLNLGIPGVMYVGGICGVIGAFFYEQSVPAAEMSALAAIGIPMLCSLAGSLLMENGFFPAYHMRKDSWITVALDGSVADDKIKMLTYCILFAALVAGQIALRASSSVLGRIR